MKLAEERAALNPTPTGGSGFVKITAPLPTSDAAEVPYAFVAVTFA
jgi:hypothetical protein